MHDPHQQAGLVDKAQPHHHGPGIPTQPRVPRDVDRDPYDFELPPSTFDDPRLTPIRKVVFQDLDPIVKTALEAVAEEAAKRAGKSLKDLKAVQEELAESYLTEVEAVAEAINRRELPRVTRAVLAERGVFHFLIAKAIEDGVGRQDIEAKADGGQHQHDHGPRGAADGGDDAPAGHHAEADAPAGAGDQVEPPRPPADQRGEAAEQGEQQNPAAKLGVRGRGGAANKGDNPNPRAQA